MTCQRAEVGSTWTPTPELRLVNREVQVSHFASSLRQVLQQKYMNDLGRFEWRDVPIVDEEREGQSGA